jgi:hypothetical protein
MASLGSHLASLEGSNLPQMASLETDYLPEVASLEDATCHII